MGGCFLKDKRREILDFSKGESPLRGTLLGLGNVPKTSLFNLMYLGQREFLFLIFVVLVYKYGMYLALIFYEEIFF